MMTVKARKWVLKKQFHGHPKLEEFSLVTEVLPELQDGEVLVQAEWLTVDPYMRKWAKDFPIGDTMPGGQVARNTAYFGFTKMCKPKAGETLIVSGAGGAVGSLVGQIGKILGLTVIGLTGSDEKVDWLVKELGFDQAFNYKNSVLDEVLAKCDHGIDCYFDNVGGETTARVIQHMNKDGRIAVCGHISTYNISETTDPVPDPYDSSLILEKKIQVTPFGAPKWKKMWFEGIIQMRDWIIDEKIKVRETVYQGFETMPQAFIDMLAGKNIGKQIIKVS